MATAQRTSSFASAAQHLLRGVAGLTRERLFSSRRGAAPQTPAYPETPWQLFWGEAYGEDLKEWLFKPLFAALDAEEKLGNVIVDAGCGAQPVSRLIPARPGRRRILLDVAADRQQTERDLRLRLELEAACDAETLSARKAFVHVCRHLEIDPDEPAAQGPLVDTMIFSDVLNYVDYRRVLAGFSRWLKPGGRLIVNNLPMRGNRALFSPAGLKDNREVVAWARKNGYQIERQEYPCRPGGESDEAEELLLLVAVKL
jgi:hypothetical protein